MISSDESRMLLATDSQVVIVRKNSRVTFDLDTFSRNISLGSYQLAKTFDNKIYEYSFNSIISHQTKETREYPFGSILDFYKHGNSFYFVKCKINRKAVLNSEGKEIAEFDGLYSFFEKFLYFLENKKLFRLNLSTQEKIEITDEANKLLNSNIILLQCKYDNELECDIITTADSSNNIHIVNNGKYSTYSWHGYTILDLRLFDDFVISVCKAGTVTRMSTRREEKRLLFKLKGKYLDMAIVNNKAYVLTNIDFTVYDLGMDSIIYREILPSNVIYRTFELEEPKSSDEDLFKIKRKSCQEILSNTDDLKESKIEYIKFKSETKEIKESAVKKNNSKKFIIFSKGSNVYILDPENLKILSQFALPSPVKYISKNKIISVNFKKKNMIFNIYTIYLEKLVLESTLEVEKKNFTDVFYNSGQIYLSLPSSIVRINNLNMLDLVYSNKDHFVVNNDFERLVVIDDKGIYDVKARDYILKQKKIIGFYLCDNLPVINIENRGIYIENGERKQLFEPLDLLDLQIINNQIRTLYIKNDKKVLSVYMISDNKAELVSESLIADGCAKIITENVFISPEGILLLQQNK